MKAIMTLNYIFYKEKIREVRLIHPDKGILYESVYSPKINKELNEIIETNGLSKEDMEIVNIKAP